MNEAKKELSLNYILNRFYSEYEGFFDEAVLKAKELVAYEGFTREEAIKEVMRMAVNSEGEFNTRFNRNGKIMRPLALKVLDLPVREYYNNHKEEKYEWVLGPAHDHCEDCLSLSKMEPRTVPQWRDLGYGLPREGDTACSYGCNCMLDNHEEK